IAPAVRLVKGAYREPRDVALASRREVDARYVELADRLLAHVPDGAFPVLGTHDLRIVGTVRRRAAALALPREALEVHMLYGIRAADQRALAASGCVVRTLVSYGSAWWAWYMRRLAEKPGENVWMVLRNI
ncbi:MAG TPA: proline dehydrogenase family protein, partial [Gemmatimonadaceae bacterium]|nr:proline dehydrogenase family protein [Gemmatimonadaceae bacterium]